MTDLNLTREERRLAEDMSRLDRGNLLLFEAMVIVPALMFAGYGVLRADLVAVVTAVVALVFFKVWRTARDLRRLQTMRSLGCKLVEHERGA